MKKGISGFFLTVCLTVLMAAGLAPLPVQAAGGSISLSVSSSSVNIGDTITVTVNGSADVEALIQVNVSCSGGAEYTGSGNSGAILEPSAGGSDSATLTYRATSPGTVTFSAAVVQAYSVETAEPLSVEGASASVTVNNAAGGEGNQGGNGGGNQGSGNGGGNQGGGSTAKSADNSLRSLSISPGTLSPAFKYSTLNYTASVAADVTSVAVDAQVSNAKARVESVTGDKDLKPGDNTIKITVKAENGTIATYTITVNRGGAPSEEPKEPEEPEEPEDTQPDQEAPQGDIVIGGKSYKVSAAFPEGLQLPEEFEKATASYNGEEVEVYNFFYGNLKLYYLKEAVAEGAEAGQDGCYFYDEASSVFFPYINILVGGAYVVALPASYNGDGVLPEGYEAAQVAMGEHVMDGLRLSELYAAGAEGAGDFYLVYGINKNGLPGWYQYDSVEGSLQRYVQMQAFSQPQEEEAPQPVFDEEKYKREYQELQEDYEEQKGRAQIMMCALVAVVVAAIIILVIILLSGRGSRRKKKGGKDGDIDFIDFDEL